MTKETNDDQRKRLTRVDLGRQDGLDGLPSTVHELLLVPDTGLAYVPMFGDGIRVCRL